MNPDDVISVQAVNKPPPGPNTSGASGAAGDSGEALKTWSWVSYILHLVVAVAAVIPGAQPSIALLIVAQIIDLIKRDEAAGTWQASHFSWRLRSVLWAGLCYVLTAPLWLAFIWPGWVAWLLISIWFLYRIVRGMERMNASRPVGL
jgi:uncharacterized membrane protein